VGLGWIRTSIPPLTRGLYLCHHAEPGSVFLYLTDCGRLHVTNGTVMPTTRPLKSRDKVRAHRERLRRRGLRPIQIWVPDIRSRTFAREAHRQSLVVAAKAVERRDQAFVDAIADWPPE
jgi:antidote-toxin recognition MazE-like antitoxin